MVRVDSNWEKLLKKSQPIDFSDEIMFDILSRLPVKSILRFKCVCKKWYKLFVDPSFIDAHLKRSVEGSNYCYLVSDPFKLLTTRSGCYLSDENLEDFRKLHFDPEYSFLYDIVGSVNGLVCIKKIGSLRRDKSCTLLWNPATRELRTVPECPGLLCYREAVGFGFDQKNNDYKVAIATSFEESTTLNVYSLRNDRWKSFGDNFVVFYKYGAHVNGRLHWMARSLSGSSIVSFDLTDEKIIEMGMPAHLNHCGILCESPESLGKSLIISFCRDEKATEIWFMKEYGDSKSWSILYNFPPHRICRDWQGYKCFFLENGKFIKQCGCNNNIVSYDPKNHVYQILDFSYLSDIVKYTESLVSVEGGLKFSHRNQFASVFDISMG